MILLSNNNNNKNNFNSVLFKFNNAMNKRDVEHFLSL